MSDSTDKTSAEVLDNLVRDIVNLFTIDENGKILFKSEKNKPDYDKSIYRLFQLLAKDAELKEKLKKACIKIHESGIFPWGMEVGSIFEKLKRDTSNRASFVEFKKYLIQEIDKISAGKQKHYLFIYPLNFKLEDAIEYSADATKDWHPFNFGFKLVPFETFNDQYLNVDDEIKKQTDAQKVTAFNDQHLNVDDEIKKQTDAQKVTALKNVKPVCNNNFSFCIIESYANNWLCAEEKCKRSFFVILGLLIFIKYFSEEKFEFVETRPSKLTYSYYFILEEGNFLNVGFFKLTLPVELLRKSLINKEKINIKTIHKMALPLEDIDERNIETFIKVLKICRDIQNIKLAELISKNLAIYSEASSAEDLELSWFKYWIIIERCLAVANTTLFGDIKARVKHLPFLKDPHGEEIVDILLDTRNTFVHYMNVEISQFDRNYTKLIAEGLLNFLMFQADKWQTIEDLERYYNNMTKGEDVLKKEQTSINLVLWLQNFYDRLQ